MNYKDINELLLRGEVDRDGLFPRIEQLRNKRFVFTFDFGLPTLSDHR